MIRKWGCWVLLCSRHSMYQGVLYLLFQILLRNLHDTSYYCPFINWNMTNLGVTQVNELTELEIKLFMLFPRPLVFHLLCVRETHCWYCFAWGMAYLWFLCSQTSAYINTQTKHSNIWPCGGHSDSNQHKCQIRKLKKTLPMFMDYQYQYCEKWPYYQEWSSETMQSPSKDNKILHRNRKEC